MNLCKGHEHKKVVDKVNKELAFQRISVQSKANEFSKMSATDCAVEIFRSFDIGMHRAE